MREMEKAKKEVDRQEKAEKRLRETETLRSPPSGSGSPSSGSPPSGSPPSKKM